MVFVSLLSVVFLSADELVSTALLGHGASALALDVVDACFTPLPPLPPLRLDRTRFSQVSTCHAPLVPPAFYGPVIQSLGSLFFFWSDEGWTEAPRKAVEIVSSFAHARVSFVEFF